MCDKPPFLPAQKTIIQRKPHVSLEIAKHSFFSWQAHAATDEAYRALVVSGSQGREMTTVAQGRDGSCVSAEHPRITVEAKKNIW